MPAEEEFVQIQRQCLDPIQLAYEVIRPIVLFAETAAERRRQTGVERTVVGDKARRFVTEGMLALADGRPAHAGRKGHVYPDAIAEYILYVKHLYPPIHLRELVRIVHRKFGYNTNHHTLKTFLTPYETPQQLALALPPFATFADAYEARWTVVRMAAEGWNKKSIAACLKLSRAHVSTLVAAFERDGFAGLEDHRTRPAQPPENQLSLPLLKEVLDLQKAYPRAGRFRLHGLLGHHRDEPPPSQRTVGRAMAINRQFHGAPGPWVSAEDDHGEEESRKHLPYRPGYRHHLWFTDIRYLVKLEGHWVYSLCIIEGYSRKILAGMATQQQDLPALLQLLYTALAAYGCPAALVSDNGSVFTAGEYLSILRALAIEPLHIEQGKPWQNLIEAQFKVQLRLADFQFEQAESFAEVQRQHAAFIDTFNTTPHWHHRGRTDGATTPQDVLGWRQGRPMALPRLQQLFGRTAWLRTVNRSGFVRVQRFYLYAEHGLAWQRVTLEMTDGDLRIIYHQTVLARYQCDGDTQRRQLHAVRMPILYTTPFVSPQLELIARPETLQWCCGLRQPAPPSTRPRVLSPQQLILLEYTA